MIKIVFSHFVSLLLTSVFFADVPVISVESALDGDGGLPDVNSVDAKVLSIFEDQYGFIEFTDENYLLRVGILDGAYSGMYQKYIYASGQKLLKESGNYYGGLRDGKFWIFDLDGGLSRSEDYVEGMLSGKVVSYFANGAPFVQFSYENDVLDGKSSVFLPDGTLVASVLFTRERR